MKVTNHLAGFPQFLRSGTYYLFIFYLYVNVSAWMDSVRTYCHEYKNGLFVPVLQSVAR